MEAGSEELQNVSLVTLGAAPVFSWSVGNYMEEFFNGLREGKFRAVKCKGCGRVYLPPRMVCERCFSKLEDWVDLPGEGTLESYTRAFVGLGEDGDLHELDESHLVGMVKHDGADTCIVARVECPDPEALEVGLKVKAILDEGAEGVLDILSHYEPCE